jgi:DnaJ-domain-containing protein 1
MFENKSNSVRALVAITRTDGAVESCTVKLPLSSKLHDALNNADQFLDVMSAEGKQSFISKNSIARIELIEVPRANQINLQRRASDNAVFDPYAVLGVAKGSDAAAIRSAYHAMAKKYHPDRFLNIELPKEMADYAAAMLVRINLAFEQIGN